ncbi:hypothetical protein [Streptomyces pacificus]|uniref:Uncharacterized protein n=1 Tax=Streptomyces pacificus TaxID=2705029 RepID=A0A6A0AMY4_9ACTN|nr:hypothetical protein [Streptomyces pacificus]GFH34329.1 hypothetical protein SCWH03_05430 [Streptomyces pacificus]
MSDRSRRRTIVCACCGQTAAHRGQGYCVACYTRWVYHGRPTSGAPKPGETPRKPPAKSTRVIPAFCQHGHRLAAKNLRFSPAGVRYCRACRYEAERAYADRQFAKRHKDHDVIPTIDGRRYCRTCNRGEHDIDDMAIDRTASGDRPDRVTAAELEAAVIQLRLYGLTYELIAARTGCSLRHAWSICKDNGLTRPRKERAA